MVFHAKISNHHFPSINFCGKTLKLWNFSILKEGAKFSFHGHTMKQNRVGNSDELDENWNAQFSVSLNGEKLRACVCRCVCAHV